MCQMACFSEPSGKSFVKLWKRVGIYKEHFASDWKRHLSLLPASSINQNNDELEVE